MRRLILFLLCSNLVFARVYDVKELYDLSYLNSDNLKIAVLRKKESNEEWDKSLSSFYPKIKIEKEFFKVNQFPVIIDGVEKEKRIHRRDMTITLDQVLYDRSKYLDYKDKKNAFFQADLQKQKENQQLIFDVIQYYFETLYKSKQLELSEQKLNRFTKILERAELKYKAGFISKADYLEAKSEKEELETQRLQYKLDYQTSKSFLEKFTGLNELEIKKKINVDNVNTESLLNYLSEFENSVDVKIQRFKLKRADISQSIAYSQFEPKVTLSYEHKQNDIPESDAQKKLTFLVSLNLFNGFYDMNNYQQSKIRRIIEKTTLNKLIKDVKQNIKNKINKVKTFHHIILSYPEIIRTKEFSLEGMRERFNVGTKSIIDLLDEENKYFEKLNKFTEYKYQFVIEYATLRQFTNSLNDNFIDQVNGFVYE